MSADDTDLANPAALLLGTYEGVVADNVDPEGAHRVRIEVDGITAKSAWARPITMGGGSHQRGGHVAPPIGAAVAVRFLGGDIERPIYETLGWSPKAEPVTEGDPAGQQPIAVRDAPKDQAHLVHSFQLGPLEVLVDEREGQRKLVLRDLEDEDCFLLWDLEKKGLQLQMSSAILVRSRGVLSLDGLTTLVKKRKVVPSPKAI